MHTTDTPVSNLSFLKEKIETIRTALFKSEYNYRNGIPNNIVHTLQTDEEGNIWFCTSVAKKFVVEAGEQFYAYLEYYHKGSDASLRVAGMTTVIDNDSENNGAANDTGNRYLLLKLKIMNAEYTEYNAVRENVSALSSIKQLWNFITAPKERHFDFS